MVALPLAVELALLGLILFLYLWLRANQLAVQALFNALGDHVPLVGKYISRAADAIVRAALEPAERWLAHEMKTLLHWLDHLGETLLSLPGEAARFADTVANNFEQLVTTTLPHAIARETRQLRADVDAVTSDLRGLAADVPREITRAKDAAFDRIKQAEAELHNVFQRGIDRLRSDVFDKAIPDVEDLVHAGERRLRGEIATVEHDVGAIGSELADLARSAGIPIGLLTALVDAVGVAAVAKALDTMVRCESKLAKACTSDPSQWARLIEGLALIALWPGLVEITRDAANLLDEHRDELRTVIVG